MFCQYTLVLNLCIIQVSNEAQKEREENKMAEYYISYNDYFGFCVIEKIKGTGKIVFAGSIEDCNRKCIELNNKK